MSSISVMIKKQFEKQVFQQLKECIENSGEYYKLVNWTENKKLRELVFLYDEDNDVLYIRHFKNEEYRLIKMMEDFCEKEQDELELIAKELVRLTNHYTTTKDFCGECNKPYNFVSDLLGIKTHNHSFISNNCEECGKENLITLNRFVNQGVDVEKFSCEICYEICVSKIEDDKIKYRDLVEPTCCKGKTICYNCVKECNKKCPFCRQDLKWVFK